MKPNNPALAYVAPVFALGFVLGTVRTVWLAPQLGPVAAVLLEIPVMLLASWILARWIIRRFQIGDRRSALIVGSKAFLILQVAEVGLAVAIGRSIASWWDGLGTTEGLLGLAGQIAFALLPYLAVSGRPDGYFRR